MAIQDQNSAADFSVGRLDPGSYVIEIVDASGKIVGVSSVTTVADNGTASVTVTVASTTRVGGAISTPLLILLIAGTAGGFGIVAAVNDDEGSPSQ